MDTVLGASVTPATAHVVLIAGENADGIIVEQGSFGIAAVADDAPPALDAAISAILAAQKRAITAGHHLLSIGLTWSPSVDSAALRSALGAGSIDSVTLVSAPLAAATLAQAVGHAIGYERLALLFVEPAAAMLAVVDCADGALTHVCRRPLGDDDTAAGLAAMASTLDMQKTSVQGLFLVGSGVDVAALKPRLEQAVNLTVIVPEEPEVALARGAALASANAPLLTASTAPLAYTQDLGTGHVQLVTAAPGYLDLPGRPDGVGPGIENLAYGAVRDDEAEAGTEVIDTADDLRPARRPLLVAGAALASSMFAAASALMIALAVDIRPNLIALRPNLGRDFIAPAEQLPASPQIALPVLQPEHDRPPVIQDVPGQVLVPSVIGPDDPGQLPVAPLQLPTRVGPPLSVPLLFGSAPSPGAAASAPVPAEGTASDPAPVPLRHRPAQPAHRTNLPTAKSTAPQIKPDAPASEPDAPASKPDKPVAKATPPVSKPEPPVVEQEPPVAKPTPPAAKPDPTIANPEPPAVEQEPPLVTPVPEPPVEAPTPEPPANPPVPEAPTPAAPPAPSMPYPETPPVPSAPTPDSSVGGSGVTGGGSTGTGGSSGGSSTGSSGNSGSSESSGGSDTSSSSAGSSGSSGSSATSSSSAGSSGGSDTSSSFGGSSGSSSSSDTGGSSSFGGSNSSSSSK